MAPSETLAGLAKEKAEQIVAEQIVVPEDAVLLDNQLSNCTTNLARWSLFSN